MKDWQLKMFDKTLKKKIKLRALKGHLPELADKACLLLTCGDNNGAFNYHLRQLGGQWSWADLEDTCIAGMEKLLGEKVHLVDAASSQLPFADQQFDVVLTIDAHEHLDDPVPLTRELARVTRPGGAVIVTTPNGDARKAAVRIKNLVGMTNREYGHKRVGFKPQELRELLGSAGLSPIRSSSHSKFFTEMLELVINFAYVKVLSGKKGAPGPIAPATEDQLKKVGKSYRLYSIIYPFFWTVSQLDRLLFFTEGYGVVVEAKR